MKKFIITQLLKFLLRALLSNMRIEQVLGLAENAQRDHTNSMKKRGYMYSEIKKIEPDGTPTRDLNLITELGVVLYKMDRQ